MADETKFCYHCRMRHPMEDMRLIETKTGKRWRCIQSIKATQKSAEARAEFGRQVSEMNSAESKAQARRLNQLRQEK